MEESATRILERLGGDDDGAWGELMDVVYDDLRARAANLMRRESPGHTLQPTELVHEAFVKLVGQKRTRYKHRIHFIAIAAIAMRRVLLNGAKARGRQKRGGDWVRVTLSDHNLSPHQLDFDVYDLNEALSKLESEDERAANAVVLTHLGGMTHEEAGRSLGVSRKTITNDLKYALTWLQRELSSN